MPPIGIAGQKGANAWWRQSGSHGRENNRSMLFRGCAMRKIIFHDSVLIGVEHISSDKKLNLTFEFGTRERCQVVLNGVQSLRVTDFIGQNVVSRVLDSKADRMPESTIVDRLNWLYMLSDGSVRVDDDVINKSMAGVIAGTLRLFCIEPSWGAELVCLCSES